MNAQAKGYAVSIGFHASLFVLLAGLASSPRPDSARTLSLDIAIGRESAAATPSAALSPQPQKKLVKEKIGHIDPVLPERPAEPVAQPEPVEPLTEDRGGTEHASASTAGMNAQHAGPALSDGQDAGPGMDLSALREHVQRSISYPALARRMGWEGRVVVSFMICADGTLRNIRLVESSGKPILDRSALDVVKRIDRLPANAGISAGISRVVLPIVYRLDG